MLKKWCGKKKKKIKTIAINSIRDISTFLKRMISRIGIELCGGGLKREEANFLCSHFDLKISKKRGGSHCSLCRHHMFTVGCIIFFLSFFFSLASHFHYDWLIHEHHFEMKKKILTHYYGRQ